MLSLMLAVTLPLARTPAFTYGTKGAMAYCAARDQGLPHLTAMRVAWRFGVSRFPLSRNEEREQINIFSREVVKRCGQYAPDFLPNRTPIQDS